ncbi:MAG: hypothetical protein IJS19_09145 [Muribaculaceae bacterium]|nr:hypothetical protein [Muribaculaceae bacterium]
MTEKELKNSVAAYSEYLKEEGCHHIIVVCASDGEKTTTASVIEGDALCHATALLNEPEVLVAMHTAQAVIFNMVKELRK